MLSLPASHAVWVAWEWNPGIVVGLGLLSGSYLGGTVVRRRRSHRRARNDAREAAWFTAGWLLLVVALASPLHALGEQLFVAHMIQHELLMAAAAPLLILGRPERRALWLLPVAARRKLPAMSQSWLGSVWRLISHPIPALAIYLATLIGWHLPVPYDAAVTSESIHAIEHLAFLGSALFFWGVVLQSAGKPRRTGAAVLLLFAAAVCSSGLGALLTMSEQAWYWAYASRTAAWGLSPLEDQQLGGLIMWVPACLAYLVAALALIADWLRTAGRRSGVAAHALPALPEPR